MSFEFKVGDRVEFGGLEGVVLREDHSRKYSLYVDLKGEVDSHWFTSDGRIDVRHTKPLLNLIERPKKKVKKTMEAWANVYPHCIGAPDFSREFVDSENDNMTNKRIACVKLTGEYEVEE
jgi:hypothetical protein